MQLHRKFKDEIQIDEVVYQINASFDVVLKILKLINDKRVHEVARLNVGLKLFIGDPLEQYDFEHRVEIFQKICEMYLDFEKPKVDRLGKPVRVLKVKKMTKS